MHPTEILKSAVDTYGKEAQVFMAVEEMSELVKELSKNYRGKDNREQISEEIADVEIMLEQLKLIFDNKTEVSAYRMLKLERLEGRLENKRIYK